MPYKDIEKQKQFQRTWVATRKYEFYKDKFCSWCGDNDYLELHHTDPSQKESHNIWSWGEEKRNAEIAKCEILCESCHDDYHREIDTINGNACVHGTKSMYRNQGCRCEECKKWNRDRSRRYRAKKRAAIAQ